MASLTFSLVFTYGSFDHCVHCIIQLRSWDRLDVRLPDPSIVYAHLHRGALPSSFHCIWEYTTTLLA